MRNSVAIVGAGIGGLAAAVAFAHQGWTVRLFEQAQQFSEVGAGLQLSPNAIKALHGISADLCHSIRRNAIAPEYLEMRGARANRLVFRLPVDPERWGAGYFNIYRPSLLQCLLDAAQSHEAVHIEGGHKVDGIGLQILAAKHDLVVVANGVHSTLALEAFGAAKPVRTDYVAFRALGAVAKGADPRQTSSCVRLGQDKHAVTYNIWRDAQRREARVNFVGIVRAKPGEFEAYGTQWDPADARQRAMQSFEAFGGGIPELLTSASKVTPWPLYRKAPVASICRGNMVLLGDAAHPVLPTFAQGAALAIEDAYLLARVVGQAPGSLAEALAQYATLRAPRVQMVYGQSVRNLHLFHQQGWFNRTFGLLPPTIAGRFMPGLILRRFDAVYGYDPVREGV